MKHALSSFLFSLGLLFPLVTACSSATPDDPGPADGTASSVDSDIKKTKKHSCASVGGACVGLSPSSCKSGHWADATKVSCGPGLGVGCCVAAPPPPPPPPPPPQCPELVQPPPGFCPAGHIQPRIDASTGCTFGFDCVANPTNACVAAGGQCVGLAPSSCAAGHWADATTHSCGGGIGVGCCMP